jgi:hypothetical protein
MSETSFLVDQQQNSTKFLDMESIKSYSTKDEYLYAMKEDLADWFNSMYSTNLAAENFIDSLENGVLICEHAKYVMKTVYESLNNMNVQQQQQFIYYKSDARPQSFQARDNISNFIKWCRNCVKVRECLMFETDDLILRKNEKNFILCLLEIARYGSKFGIQVPTIIKLEQEIDNELKQEIELNKQQGSLESSQNSSSSSSEDEDEDNLANNLDDSLENDVKSSTSISVSPSSSLTSSTSSFSNKKQELTIDLKATSSISSLSPPTSSSSISLAENQTIQQPAQSQQQQEKMPKKLIKKNLNNEFFKNMPVVVPKQQNLKQQTKPESRSSSINNKIYTRSRSNSRTIETELEKHVNKIINRCTCTQKFPVIQIGEGKYRIGSTKTIVFIRVCYNFAIN